MTTLPKQNRIYLVADEQAFRTSLEGALIAAGFELRTFASQGEFLRAVASLETGCLISSLQGRAGFELTEEVRRRGLAFPTIVVADLRTPRTVTRAMKLGIAEVLPRRVAPDRLAEAIKRVLAIFRDLTRTGESPSTMRARFLALTALERQIVERLVSGRTKAAIAAELAIELRLVEAGTSRAMRKLRASNLTHLIRMVLDGGIKLSAISLAVIAFAPRIGVM